MMLWKLPFMLARLVPYRLRLYIVMNAACDAATGEWSHVEAPAVTISDMLKRMK
jgi:hypothetical protein